MPFIKVTDDFYVAPQISVDDVSVAKNEGFELFIMNRPDGETSDQPALADVLAALEENGIDFKHIPLSGPPSMDKVDDTALALTSNAGKKTLAFCRSGTRSITLWALANAKLKSRSPDEILSLSTAAGYDLSGLRPALYELSGV